MLKIALVAIALAAPALLLTACSSSSYATAEQMDDAVPGIPVGAKVRNASLETVEGKRTNLNKVLDNNLTVVTFYRGGWCPYCVKALADWNANIPEIESHGARFVAITTEKPADAYRTANKNSLAFDVLVDSDLAASRAFNILFDVDPDTKTKYGQFGIDVAASNASGTWQLPHPATFIIDAKGVIRYAHVNPDYATGRANPQDVIAALSELD